MKRVITEIFFVILGSIIFSSGIGLFLVPNDVIDGGIVGISLMLSHLTEKPLGVFLITLSIPFLFLGWKQIGKKFTFYTILAVVISSIAISYLHHYEAVTQDLLLSTVFGGIFLGLGVGIIIKVGGSLDGTEIASIVLNRKLPFSVGEIILFINLFIFTGAIFVFGLENALYSALAYYVASKTIDVTIEGLDQTRSVLIISDYSEEIARKIQTELHRNVTFLKGEGGYTGDEKKIIFSAFTRLEESALKTIVNNIDEDAFIAISHIHDIKGGKFNKGHH